MKLLNLFAGILTVGIAGLLASATAVAQEGQDKATVETGQRIRLPAEQSMVEVWADYPDSVRVGESFQYKIHVKNLTDNIVLDQVTIRQHAPQGFEIESSKPPMHREKSQGDQQAQDNQQAKQEKQGQKQEQGKQQDEQQKQDKGQTVKWTISDLQPGQTKTIEVKATSDQEGSSRTCLAISYTPALCLMTKFVKQEVNVSKAVPEEASICQILVFLYRVSNTGSGKTAALLLRDDLPEGLQTEDGKDKVEIPVDPLDPGQSKDIEVRLVAKKTGELGSRATIVERGQNGDSKGNELARSERKTTRVEKPQLTVKIDGPQAQYVNQPMTYTITVTNEGKVQARSTQLTLEHDQKGVRLVNTTEAEEVKQQGGNQGQPKEAPQGDQAKEDQSQAKQNAEGKQDQQGKDEQKASKTWDLGDLGPGQSMRVRATMIGTERTTLNLQAIAGYECAPAKDFIETKATTTAQTEIIALPALQISVSDKSDPVAVGQEYVYVISVGNEGAVADKNVQVKVDMPKELKFVKGSGATKVEGQDGNAKIHALDQLAAGDEARWEVHVRPESAGDVRFKIEVTSDYLTRPATAEEPTRIFSTEKGAAPGKESAPAKPEAKQPAEKQPEAKPSEAKPEAK
jgi:hypothetical protein